MTKRESLKCHVCGNEMQMLTDSYGHERKVSFRIGGMTGEANLLFGAVTQWGEDVLPLNIRVCPKCGLLELIADEKVKQALIGKPSYAKTPKGFLKKCVGCGEEIPVASEVCPHCGRKQA